MFEQIWNWITQNIVPILTASNILLVLGVAVTLLPKLKKIFGNNAETIATLNQRMSDVKTITAELTTLKTALDSLKKDNEDKAETDKELKELLAAVMEKTDAVLDIQDMAYSAVKISDVKDSIKNIRANVRFETTRQRKKMAQEARDAAAKITELTAVVSEQLATIEHTAEPTKADDHIGITL